MRVARGSTVDEITKGIKSHTPAKLTENLAPGNRWHFNVNGAY